MTWRLHKTAWKNVTMREPAEDDDFESWADDTVELMEEVEAQLKGLRLLMHAEGFREAPEARKLAATMSRCSRIHKLLCQQLEETKAHAKRNATLRRLGRRRG